MSGRRDPRPWPDRIGDAFSNRPLVDGWFTPADDGVAFAPAAGWLRGREARLEPGEARAARAVLLAAHVLANTVWVAVVLFSAGNVLFRSGALSSGFLWACLGLLVVANALLGAVHTVLPWALAAGAPPHPGGERAEREPA